MLEFGEHRLILGVKPLPFALAAPFLSPFTYFRSSRHPSTLIQISNTFDCSLSTCLLDSNQSHMLYSPPSSDMAIHFIPGQPLESPTARCHRPEHINIDRLDLIYHPAFLSP